MKKMTKKEKFAIARSIVEASNHEMAQDIMDFFDKEVEMLNRKHSATGERKPTAAQKQNEVLKTAILDAMEVDRLYTVSEMIKEIPECEGLTTQKISALCRQMVESANIEKIKENGKTLFRIV